MLVSHLYQAQKWKQNIHLHFSCYKSKVCHENILKTLAMSVLHKDLGCLFTQEKWQNKVHTKQHIMLCILLRSTFWGCCWWRLLSHSNWWCWNSSLKKQRIKSLEKHLCCLLNLIGSVILMNSVNKQYTYSCLHSYFLQAVFSFQHLHCKH